MRSRESADSLFLIAKHIWRRLFPKRETMMRVVINNDLVNYLHIETCMSVMAQIIAQ
jgi:hypothetical protein